MEVHSGRSNWPDPLEGVKGLIDRMQVDTPLYDADMDSKWDDQITASGLHEADMNEMADGIRTSVLSGTGVTSNVPISRVRYLHEAVLAHDRAHEALRISVAPTKFLAGSRRRRGGRHQTVASLIPAPARLVALSDDPSWPSEELVVFALPFVTATDLWMAALSEPIVPIEQSPLSGRSVTELLTMTSVTSYIATVTGKPVLALVVSPVALIVFSAASGAASGLHDGVRHNILRRMGVPVVGRVNIGTDPPDSPADPNSN